MKKLVLALMLILVPCQIHASLIVDTGQPTSNGYLLSQDQWLAAEFIIDESYTLTDIQTYMFVNYGGLLDIVIYEGTIMKTYLDQYLTPNTSNLLYRNTIDVSQGLEDWRGLSDIDWKLTSGTYWIAFETRDPSLQAGLLYGSSNPSGYNEAYTWDGKYWNPENYNYGRMDLGIKIWGDLLTSADKLPCGSIPEPATMLLFGTSLIGLATLGRKRFKV